MGRGIAPAFHERFDHMGRSRQIRIAHAKRDDLGPAGLGFRDLAIDLREQIRGQLLDAPGGPQERSPR